MKKYFIYGLVQSGDVFYIGLTTNIEKRLACHRLKYGNNVDVKILKELFCEKKDAHNEEGWWIKKYIKDGIELCNSHLTQDKRRSRTYKCKNLFYQKAYERASKENSSLVKLIECVVVAYSHGMDIKAVKGRGKKQKYITLDEVAAIAQLQP